ncbi:hypothetical protein AOLI_G00293110 [Acnodon oligacanthus]
MAAALPVGLQVRRARSAEQQLPAVTALNQQQQLGHRRPPQTRTTALRTTRSETSSPRKFDETIMPFSSSSRPSPDQAEKRDLPGFS